MVPKKITAALDTIATPPAAGESHPMDTLNKGGGILAGLFSLVSAIAAALKKKKTSVNAA
jgi:hypothetical protein